MKLTEKLTALLLLSICEYGKAVFMKIATPSSAVEFLSDIRFSITYLSPLIYDQWFDRLDCGIISSIDPNYKILVAQYDTDALTFKTPSYGIPKFYRGRVTYSGHYSFIIKRIHFTDRLLKVVCLLNYKTGIQTKYVQSSIYQITFVYVNPTFQLNTTTEGTVWFVPGSRITIQCIVKSFPESKISWEANIDNVVSNSTSSKTPHKNEFITTSILTLGSPTSKYSGKKVNCMVLSHYGTELLRRFTLQSKDGDSKEGKTGNKRLISILVSVFGGIVLGIILMVVLCKCCKCWHHFDGCPL